MNGYGEEYGVSYRTLRKIFEVLKTKQSEAEARNFSTRVLQRASLERGDAPRLSALSTTNESMNSDHKTNDVEVTADTNHHKNSHAGLMPEVMDDKMNQYVMEENDDGDDETENAFSYQVEVSMMEIYNDQVYDLLNGTGEVALDIRQAADGNIHVPDLKQVMLNC
jgi:hypothetical protein